MSSSGRYKSRLLNFLSQRSRQVVDRCDLAFRHLKVTAVWGAQVLLYPAYVLFQSVRLVGQQLQAAVQQGLPQLQAWAHPERDNTPPTVDTPLQQVLQAVHQFALPADLGLEVSALALPGSSAIADPSPPDLTPTAPSSPMTSSPSQFAAQGVRGIASLLETHALVLVTPENHLLDILTPDQQRHLHQRIVWEVAHYQRYLKVAQSAQKSFAEHWGWRKRQLPPPKDSKHLLPPIRWARQMMAWVQTGPVAIAIDLFAESHLALRGQTWALEGSSHNPPRLPSFSTPQLMPKPMLVWVDQTAAQLETHSLALVSTELATGIVHRTTSVIQRLKAYLAPRPNSPGATSTNAYQEGSDLEPSEAGLQVLLWAAVDYFFGDRGWKLPWQRPSNTESSYALEGSTTQPLPALPGTSSTPHRREAWLTLKDLFGTPDPGFFPGDLAVTDTPTSLTVTATPYEPIPTQPEGRLLQPQPLALPSPLSLKQTLQHYWGQLSARRKTQQAQPPQVEDSEVPAPLVKTVKMPKPATVPTPAVTFAFSTGSATAAIAPEPALNLTYSFGEPGSPTVTWIETEAIPMGYVKHPLEQVLEWLDRALLWVEEFILQMGRWLTQLWRG